MFPSYLQVLHGQLLWTESQNCSWSTPWLSSPVWHPDWKMSDHPRTQGTNHCSVLRSWWALSCHLLKHRQPHLLLADEHLTPGKHWHAELGTSAALHQDLPGPSSAACIPWLPQRTEVGPAHLDFQPECYPHGPWWEGTPLHGLTLVSAVLTASWFCIV